MKKKKKGCMPIIITFIIIIIIGGIILSSGENKKTDEKVNEDKHVINNNQPTNTLLEKKIQVEIQYLPNHTPDWEKMIQVYSKRPEATNEFVVAEIGSDLTLELKQGGIFVSGKLKEITNNMIIIQKGKKSKGYNATDLNYNTRTKLFINDFARHNAIQHVKSEKAKWENKKAIYEKQALEREKAANLEKLKSKISYRGYHIELVKILKKQLNDEKSFEHIETSYLTKNNSDGFIIMMDYSAKNAFGGRIKSRISAETDNDGNIIQILSR